MGEEERPILEQKLLRKIERLHERREAERIEQGWQRDEEHDWLVPPGWVKLTSQSDALRGPEEEKGAD
jgi:hypothetical protein